MMQPEDKPTRAFSSGIMQSCLRGISLIHFAAEVSIFTRIADRITQLRPQINHGGGFFTQVAVETRSARHPYGLGNTGGMGKVHLG